VASIAQRTTTQKNFAQSFRKRLALLTLAPILVLPALIIFLPPDGLERAKTAQFLGRFHPLAVHFPIALILLVPLLELAGRSRRLPNLRSSVDFVLALVTMSSTAAAILGWCLARSGAYSGRLVTQHMWGGALVAGACWLCWVLRGRGLHFAYALGLVTVVGLTSWTGYRGGQLVQGENHLTEEMPAGLRKLMGLSLSNAIPARSDPAYFYGAHVEPIFVQNCYSCHGPEKQKSQLRLDSYDALMRGGKHGPVIKAGDVKGSELFRSVSLPASDDDAMPTQGKRHLSVNEMKLIELWIAAGAPAKLPANAIAGAPTNEPPVVAEVTFEEIDPVAVTKARAPLAEVVAQLRTRFPNALEYESRSSAGLVLDASMLGPKFTDDDAAALKPVAGQMVIADFSGTAVTDRSATVFAAMKQLRVLRLMRTKITDTSVLALGGMDRLESLDLFGTAVTPACLNVADQLPKLRHLYAGETKIPGDVPVPGTLMGKLLF
jgi:mono/diheme cytochrome c family protein